MPNYDPRAATLAAALEAQLRRQMALEIAVLAEEHDFHASPAPVLAAAHGERSARAKEDAQRQWLRESLEREMAPRWLIKRVMASWVYVPEWEWE